MIDDLLEYIQNNDINFKGYIELMIKKTESFLTDKHPPAYEKDMEEWLELMAFCEMMILIRWSSKKKADQSEELFKKLNALCEDIRSGKYF